MPLYNHVGTGYVYASAHRTDDQAADESLEWLRPLKKPIWSQYWKGAKVDLAQILKTIPDHKALLREI